MKKQNKFCSLSNIYLGKLCPYGHDHDGNGNSYRHKSNKTCVECQRIRIRNWSNTEKGKQSLKNRKLKYKHKSIIKNKEYRNENYKKIYSYNKKYREDNRDWYLSYYRIYNSSKKARKLNATPKWAEKETIKNIYRLAHSLTLISGINYEVDHIIPLTSKNVCGLHVHGNLRIITATDNRRKGNRWWPD